MKNNIKVGFSLHSLDKYINSLNNYNKYKKIVFDIISINSKLNSICKFIKSIHDTKIEKDIIKRIDYILDEYRWYYIWLKNSGKSGKNLQWR